MNPYGWRTRITGAHATARFTSLSMPHSRSTALSSSHSSTPDHRPTSTVFRIGRRPSSGSTPTARTGRIASEHAPRGYQCDLADGELVPSMVRIWVISADWVATMSAAIFLAGP